jgi:hypothetical protein
MNLASLLAIAALQNADRSSGWPGVIQDPIKVVLSGIAGWVVKLLVDTYDERRAFFRSDRLGSIAGAWLGGGQDEITTTNPFSLDFELSLTFDVKGKKISGKGVLRAKNENAGASGYAMEFSGGFYTDDYLYLTYRNANQRYRHLGVIVLHQLPSGNLSGNYAGLSIARNRFVTGSLELRKTS